MTLIACFGKHHSFFAVAIDSTSSNGDDSKDFTEPLSTFISAFLPTIVYFLPNNLQIKTVWLR